MPPVLLHDDTLAIVAHVRPTNLSPIGTREVCPMFAKQWQNWAPSSERTVLHYQVDTTELPSARASVPPSTAICSYSL